MCYLASKGRGSGSRISSPQRKKVVSDILAKIAFFALTGVYGQDTLSGKVLHLDFV